MIVNSVTYRAGRRAGEIPLEDISEVLRDPGSFVWLGLHEPSPELLLRVQEEFGLHDLAIEDVRHAHQRPKLETYGDTLLIVLDTAQIVNDQVRFGETHIFVGSNFIITVRHGASVSYAPVRSHCEKAPNRLAMGPGFALYAIMDFIVDNYQPVVHRLQELFQHLEARIVEDRFDRASVVHLYRLKGELLRLEDAMSPVQDICAELIRLHESIVRRELRPYFRDIGDHVARSLRSIGTLREMLTAAVNVHLALVTVAQNEVVKRLAGWGAILAIPTVVFSLYGMNFRHMPELGSRWGYPLVIFLTLGACIGLFWRLRRARWI